MFRGTDDRLLMFQLKTRNLASEQKNTSSLLIINSLWSTILDSQRPIHSIKKSVLRTLFYIRKNFFQKNTTHKTLENFF